jgi:hypothetical protein
MFSLDDRPAPPETPAFSADMEQFLVSAAHAHATAPRPKRRALVAVTVGAAAVAAIGAAVAFNGGGGAAPPANASAVHVHLADFSVDMNARGTVTVTLNHAQILDPAALEQALAQAGVPAKITIGSACYNPHPDAAALSSGALAPHQPGPDGTSVLVITPSKLPPGSTLAIGYLHTRTRDGVHFGLLTAGAPVTCSDNPPQGNEKPVLVPRGPVRVG